MVVLIKRFVVNFELLLNVNLIVGTILNNYKRPRPQFQQIGITLIIESIFLFYYG